MTNTIETLTNFVDSKEFNGHWLQQDVDAYYRILDEFNKTLNESND